MITAMQILFGAIMGLAGFVGIFNSLQSGICALFLGGVLILASIDRIWRA